MKNITVASLVAAPLLVFALAMPSLAADPAPTTCKDGTTTTSTGKGTCSGHGGVQKAKTTTPSAAPTAAPTAAPAKAVAPAAPTASGAGDDLQGWNDDHLYRQRHLQWPWRCPETN